MKISDRIWIWIAWLLPRRLVTWAFSRVVGEATTGKWLTTEVPTLTIVEALERWKD